MHTKLLRGANLKTGQCVECGAGYSLSPGEWAETEVDHALPAVESTLLSTKTSLKTSRDQLSMTNNDVIPGG
jgi:hypothetical protein